VLGGDRETLKTIGVMPLEPAITADSDIASELSNDRSSRATAPGQNRLCPRDKRVALKFPFRPNPVCRAMGALLVNETSAEDITTMSVYH